MAHEINKLSETEFRVNSIYVYKDHNGKWIATPPIESQSMQDAGCSE